MITFSVPKDLLLYSHEMGTPSDFSVRGFSGGQSEDGSSMTFKRMADGEAPIEPWTPAEITTALWLDAADSSTITLNGSTVSEWRDKSGNGRHATQTTAASQPTLTGTDIVFAADSLSCGTLNMSIGGYGIAAVYASSATGSTHAGFINIRSSNYEDPEIRFGKVNDVLCYADGAYKININADATTKNISVMSLASTETALYKHGTSLTSATASVLSPVVSIKIGQFDASIASYSGTRNGTANEIVIFTYSIENRQRIEGYLAHKWNLAASLPSDHPYKSAPPTV